MTMLARATVTTDLAKIRENAATIVEALPGVSIVGVTKVTCASPEVARAMLAGGVSAIGESRLENAQRLRDAGITAPIWLVRAPVPALADDTVRLTDVSLVSEVEIAEALDAAALAAGATHEIIAMVDIGDLREGMLPAELPELPRRHREPARRERPRHRREPHLLRRCRPERREHRRARRARRRRRATARSTARALGRQLDLGDAGRVGASTRRASTTCGSASRSCWASIPRHASGSSGCTPMR